MADRGRRICVYGFGGKIVTALRVGKALKLPVIELDALAWEPDWVETPWAEVRERVRVAMAALPAGWVIDGNYSYLKAEFLPHADTVIWLNLPYYLAVWRVFKRAVARARGRRAICGENYESWRRAFLSRDSILLWAANHYWGRGERIRGQLAEIEHSATVIELRSAREHRDFLDRLETTSMPRGR